MNMAPSHIRYCALSMRLAAYLDGRYVEMHILTDTGKIVSIVCEKDSIFTVQRSIEKIGQDCPEIATWKPAANIKTLRGNTPRSYELAPATSVSTPKRRWLPAAAYMVAGLICLAVGPAAFIAVDHGVVVRWSNKLLDLVSG